METSAVTTEHPFPDFTNVHLPSIDLALSLGVSIAPPVQSTSFVATSMDQTSASIALMSSPMISSSLSPTYTELLFGIVSQGTQIPMSEVRKLNKNLLHHMYRIQEVLASKSTPILPSNVPVIPDVPSTTVPSLTTSEEIPSPVSSIAQDSPMDLSGQNPSVTHIDVPRIIQSLFTENTNLHTTMKEAIQRYDNMFGYYDEAVKYLQLGWMIYLLCSTWLRSQNRMQFLLMKSMISRISLQKPPCSTRVLRPPSMLYRRNVKLLLTAI